MDDYGIVVIAVSSKHKPADGWIRHNQIQHFSFFILKEEIGTETGKIKIENWLLENERGNLDWSIVYQEGATEAFLLY